MFEDFKNAVLEFYAEKKAKGQLSNNLLKPTKAQLRKECLLILKHRYLQKDDETIRAFFDPTRKFENHELSITKFDLEDFKSLQNFFLGQPSIRKEENIKLLAWLINFEPRPYVFGTTYGTVEQPESTSDSDALEQVATSEIETSPKEVISGEVAIIPESKSETFGDVKPSTPWKKIASISLLSILFLSLGILIYSKNESGDSIISDDIISTPKVNIINASNPQKAIEPKPNNIEKKQCMYWNDDRYEAIACDQPITGTSIIPLDQKKLINFRRIKNLDTINTTHIGKAWYFKIAKDSIVLFTGSGSYPLDTNRILRPLSSYMLNKYILSKRLL